MSLNNPTCKESLQVHAARLREMIEDLACFGLDADGAAALLAGAEALEALPLAQEQAAKVWGLACERDELKVSRDKALEAVEVAKAALRDLVRAIQSVEEDPKYQRVWIVHQLHNGPYTGKQYEAELNRATAAMERLEGK